LNDEDVNEYEYEHPNIRAVKKIYNETAEIVNDDNSTTKRKIVVGCSIQTTLSKTKITKIINDSLGSGDVLSYPSKKRSPNESTRFLTMFFIVPSTNKSEHSVQKQAGTKKTGIASEA
jgi:C4-type Zn-finger protein